MVSVRSVPPPGPGGDRPRPRPSLAGPWGSCSQVTPSPAGASRPAGRRLCADVPPGARAGAGEVQRQRAEKCGLSVCFTLTTYVPVGQAGQVSYSSERSQRRRGPALWVGDVCDPVDAWAGAPTPEPLPCSPQPHYHTRGSLPDPTAWGPGSPWGPVTPQKAPGSLEAAAAEGAGQLGRGALPGGLCTGFCWGRWSRGAVPGTKLAWAHCRPSDCRWHRAQPWT